MSNQMQTAAETGAEHNSPLPIHTDHASRIPQLMAAATAISKSHMIPEYLQGNPFDCLILIEMGEELGLPPMMAITNITIIDGTPHIPAFLLLSIIKRRPDYAESVLREYTSKRVVVEVTRIFSAGDNHMQETFYSEYTQKTARERGIISGRGNREGNLKRLEALATFEAIKSAWPELVSGYRAYEELTPADLERAASHQATLRAHPQQAPEKAAERQKSASTSRQTYPQNEADILRKETIRKIELLSGKNLIAGDNGRHIINTLNTVPDSGLRKYVDSLENILNKLSQMADSYSGNEIGAREEDYHALPLGY